MPMKEDYPFLRNMHNIVWSYVFKREGHFVSYLAQVALAVGSVGAALGQSGQPYLFVAQIFALLMLGWGAAMAITVNYDYRINQAMSWALEKKFGATKEIIPPDFGRPKKDLIDIYRIHLVVFLLIGIMVVFVSLIPHKQVFSCLIDFYLIDFLIILGFFLFSVVIILCRIYHMYKKFNKHFTPEWQKGITEFREIQGT